LGDKVLHTIGKFARHTPVHDVHVAFAAPYVHDFITKSCRQQAEVIQNHHNAHVCNIRQGKAQYMKHKRLKLGSGQAYEHSSE
jgi:hypothetical protein